MNRRDSRDERERLCRMISRWNDRRIELLQISMPNENLEFEGVMRFYFQYQDDHRQKVATKCIRVSNSATVKDVIEVLVQKFRPDLRMLPNLSSYALYEIHNYNQEERRMCFDEKPLLTMLKWTTKDIDGRFVLRNELKMQFSLHSKLVQGKKGTQQTKRKKKSPKVERKKNKSMNRTYTDVADVDINKGEIAKFLYSDYPSSHFTRSITNPDMNLINRTYETVSDCPVSIESTMPGMPIKSILAAESDTAAQIVASAVEKFCINYDPDDYCLVQVTMDRDGTVLGEIDERILGDDESPVKLNRHFIISDQDKSKAIKFQLRRRDSFKEMFTFSSVERLHESKFPVLVDISCSPNGAPSHSQNQFHLTSCSTEIGSHVSLDCSSHIHLASHGICPRHCVINHCSNGIYTLSLLDPLAIVKVNEKIVNGTVQLLPNCILHIGDKEVFKFIIPPSAHIRSHSALHDQPQSHDCLAKAYSSDDLGHSLYIKDYLPLKVDDSQINHYINVISDKAPNSPVENTEHHASMSSMGVKKRHNSAPGEPTVLESSETELAILPASLVFNQANVVPLLQSLITNVNGSVLQFKLGPAYAIYMIARYHLSSDFIPEQSRHHSLIQMLKSTCSFIKRAVKESRNIAGALAFWLSNTSELLHFLRRDYRLYMFAHEFENSLTSIIHMAYKHFTEYMIQEIGVFLPAFLSDSPDADNDEINHLEKQQIDVSQEPDVVAISHNSSLHQNSVTSIYWSSAVTKIRSKGRATLSGVLSTLSATSSLLHLCKVNNILSILIFSLLFRYISMRLFNKLITEPWYCSKATGQKLLRRLERLKAWADKESLKLAADEHLQIICQAAKLLISVKNNPEEAESLHSLFPQLNSHQVKVLLSNCEARDEITISSSLVEMLIKMAFIDVDQQLMTNGHEVHLQEDPNLELPFLIPEHGYSCDTMRGVPVGLEEYLDTVTSLGLCQLIVSKDSLGCWVPPRIATSKQWESPISTQASTQMSQTLPKNYSSNPYPYSEFKEQISSGLLNLDDIDTVTVTLNKEANKSLGINICESRDPLKGEGTGIFIKSLSKNGPAAQNGHLHPGDQLLRIDNTSMNGYTKELVIKLLRSSPDQVTITVATHVAQIFQLNDVLEVSPEVPRKLNRLPQHLEVSIPKEGSSHAMKAARRELRRQQQTPAHDDIDHSHSYVTSPIPSSHVTKWLQEQQEIAQQKKPAAYERISVRYTPSKINVSMSSLIPEREEPALPVTSSIHRAQSDHYLMTDSETSELSRSPYNHFTISGSTSRLPDQLQSNLVQQDQLMFDSCATSSSQMPYRDLSLGLLCHPSDLDANSQSYPSLAREKLSMEVGYHTQLSSTGLSVSSVLDQLSRKGKKDEYRLQVSELQGLEVDEIQLEKQRMHLLFYRQQKEARDQELVEQHDTWSSKNQYENKNSADEEELLMDPNKLLQISKLRQNFESVKKIINEQRKRYRELHFTKEREEQSLNQAESRLNSQSCHFMSTLHAEDEARWHRDQRRRLKDMERYYSEKKEEVHRLEVKEREAKTKLKALELHASILKKQLHACEANLETSHDIPEKEWPNTRQFCVMSTDSITTGSSWVSSENVSIAKGITSVGLDSNIAEFHPTGLRNSPLGCYSDSSSPGPYVGRRYQKQQPEFHGSSELPTLIRNRESTRHYEQEEYLRMLKGEHCQGHHLSILEGMSLHFTEERTTGLKMDGNKPRVGSSDDQSESSENNLSESNHKQFGCSIDSSNVESSLSSSTPDVVPQVLAPLLKKPHFHQSFTSSDQQLFATQHYQPDVRPTTATGRLYYQIPQELHDQVLSRPKSHDNLLLESSDQISLPGGDREHASNRPRKAGGPHSYSRGRPDPPSNEERGRSYREKGLIPSGKYVQRQQTEL